MAFIAPYVGLKISPTKTICAQMGLAEEFAVETAINQIQTKTDIRKLLLLVNSPGGLVQSSYKIARALRKAFNEICFCSTHRSKRMNITCPYRKQDSYGHDEPAIAA